MPASSPSNPQAVLEKVGNTVSMSSVQQVIWFDQMLQPKLPCYQIGLLAEIEGEIQVDLLTRAINKVANAHDGLRLLPTDASSPSLQVIDHIDVPLPLVDVSGRPDARAQALQLAEKAFRQALDPADGAMWSHMLVRFAADRYLWVHRYHHLILDGYGVPMAGKAFIDEYNRLLSGVDKPMANAPSYTTFIEAEQAYMASERPERDRAFWRQRYPSVPPALLPARFAMTDGGASSSGKLVWQMSRATFDDIQAYANERRLTAAHFFLALIHSYFSRVTDAEEIVIGVPVHNRTKVQHKQMLGMFSSINPIGVSVDASRSFEAQMRAMANELRRCYRHQRLPISDINREVQLTRTGRRQMFDVTFSFEEFDADVSMGGHHPIFSTLHNGYEQTPLAIAVKNYHQALGVQIEIVYNHRHLDDAEALRLRDRLETACNQILTSDAGPISDLSLMTAQEYRQVVLDFNDTAAPFDESVCIHQLFERQAAEHPERIAVAFEDASLSYSALNHRANQWARHLQAQGVRSNQIVGVALERSLDMVVALLAIMKTGAAYLPIDASYPTERHAGGCPTCLAADTKCLARAPARYFHPLAHHRHGCMWRYGVAAG